MRDATVRRDTVMNSFEREYPELYRLATENGMEFKETTLLLKAVVDGSVLWFSSVLDAELYVSGFLKGRGVL